jgi:two-component system, NtrC family, response regulator PilR
VSKQGDRRSSAERPTVLIIDDEADLRELVELTMVRMGLAVEVAGSVAAAKALIDSRKFDLCLTDMRLPDGEGLELVRYISARNSDLPVAVITAYGNTENAVAALKAGAFDYVSKPISLDQLRTLVKSALQVPGGEALAKASGRAHRLLGSSPPIEHVRAMIAKLSRSQAPIYITGESGSGKELAARLIHEGGSRADKLFVPVNCGAIPESLVESEFFGYRKGAFTGAGEDREGFFHAASGGTLFLDEVADLPLAMQVKLLRAIQEKRVRKVGATSEDPVDVRMICATHQNLQALVEAGKFRQDLYYRLAVIELRMPALRESREDIPSLAEAVLARLAVESGSEASTLSPAALAALSAYEFPGNARELENVLERAIALSGSTEIHVEDLQLSPPVATQEPPLEPGGERKLPLQEYLDRVERDAILEALTGTRFNRTQAAKNLGITFRALRYRMERLGIKEAA